MIELILVVIMGADTDKPFTNRTIKMNKSNRYWLNTKYLIVILTVILILVIYLYTSREIDNYKWREPNEEQGTGGEKHQQSFEICYLNCKLSSKFYLCVQTSIFP